MTIKFPIYLDNNASTPVDPRVLAEMFPYFTEKFGNEGSIDHLYGAEAKQAVSLGRERLASLIGANPDEIIFTSGATESDNLAIRGIVEANSNKGDHIITSVIEHEAVLNTCKHLEKIGKKVTYLPVDSTGLIDLGALEAAITEKTVLITIMAANNEIGTIQPIQEIGALASSKEIIFHTDAAQTVGHIPTDVEKSGISTMSISAHKMYGPKGIGAVYLRRRINRVKMNPIIFGGGQEHGLRSGTLNVPGIVGLGKAAEIAGKEMKNENERLSNYTNQMFNSIKKTFPSCELNGHKTQRLPHNLNIYFPGVEAKGVVHFVKEKLALSVGSACTTTSVEPSHVITALGFGRERAFSSIRLGLGRFTTKEEVDFSTKILIENVLKLSSG